MLLRVCACPFHKMDIAGQRLASLFLESQGDEEEAEAYGHPAKEPPCRISLHDSACNLADLELLQTQIFMILFCLKGGKKACSQNRYYFPCYLQHELQKHWFSFPESLLFQLFLECRTPASTMYPWKETAVCHGLKSSHSSEHARFSTSPSGRRAFFGNSLTKPCFISWGFCLPSLGFALSVNKL